MVLQALFPLKEPAEVTAASGRYEIATARIHAVSRVPSKPDFTSEVYGIDPTHVVFFSLDKADTAASRTELARAIRSFLSSSDADAVVTYTDVPVVRRIGEERNFAEAYRDFVPEDQVASWEAADLRIEDDA